LFSANPRGGWKASPLSRHGRRGSWSSPAVFSLAGGTPFRLYLRTRGRKDCLLGQVSAPSCLSEPFQIGSIPTPSKRPARAWSPAGPFKKKPNPLSSFWSSRRFHPHPLRSLPQTNAVQYPVSQVLGPPSAKLKGCLTSPLFSISFLFPPFGVEKKELLICNQRSVDCFIFLSWAGVCLIPSRAL